MSSTADLDLLINQYAGINSLDVNLVKAIIQTESAYNPFAMRYEPAAAASMRYLVQYQDFASKLGISPETEIVLQCSSYGLMQIMGFVFRELGWTDTLTKCFDTEVNVRFGTLKLKQLFIKYQTETDVISAYNQGNNRKTPGLMYYNQAYVDRVSGYLNQLRALK